MSLLKPEDADFAGSVDVLVIGGGGCGLTAALDMFEKHARKGRLIYVAGKLQTRRWKKDGEDSDRFSTEILLVPGGRVQFLDKGTTAPMTGSQDMPADAVDNGTGDTEEIPF